MRKSFEATLATFALLFLPQFLFLTFCLPAQGATLAEIVMPWMFGDLAPPSPKPEITEPQKVARETQRIEALGSRDLVILIDRSGSMDKTDCPASPVSGAQLGARFREQSRWQWCCEQTRNLAGQTRGVLNNGLRVVVFSSLQKEYDNVQFENVAGIFEANPPVGSTNVAAAIKGQLDEYFRRRSHPEENSKPLKPLLIAVITDGCFEHAIPIQRAITEATNRMGASDEIAVAFLQVGHDKQGTRLLAELDAGLGSIFRKASYDIVTSTSFAELEKLGLTNALLELVCADIAAK